MKINIHPYQSRLLGMASACALFLSCIAPAHSVPVFPREIQACVTNGTCTAPALQFISPDMHVYQYLENNVLKALIGYELQVGSEEVYTDNRSQVLGGPIWVSANQFYDLNEERHFFTLHLDQVIPQPQNLWIFDTDGLDVELGLTTADLFGGGGYFYDAEPTGGGFISEGDLETLGDQGQITFNLNKQSLVPCLARGCEAGAEFNLINFAYVISGTEAALVLDLTDTRNLLYSQFTGFQFIDLTNERTIQNYYVKPVSLPAAVWLFGSGLIGLIGLARRKTHP